MNYLIVHPENHNKLKAIKAVLKALDVEFDEAKATNGLESITKSHKAVVLEGLKEAINEIRLIKQGKLKGTPARELLDEL